MFQRFAAGLCILVCASSCSLFKKDIKVPPETLYRQGEQLYTKKKYDDAAEKWKKAKETTTSPLLKTVLELKLADALYKDEKYLEAAAEYENFRKLHPKNPKAPYALYMVGMSNFKQVEKIDTDQSPVKNSVTVFESFLQEYPNAELTKKVREKLAECRTKQAAYEIYVGRFYYRTNKYGAAIGRFNYALEKYPGAAVNDEALYLLCTTYLKTGDMTKAKDAMGRLIKEYPKSRFADMAKDLMKKVS